jgi:hypothetical protein
VSGRNVARNSDCGHHWLIETPQGATSWGMCKLCGESREFANSASDALWDAEGVPGAKAQAVASYGTRITSSIEDDEGL